jgi:DNA (cytosine-5)-methyltransferase 1
MGYHRAFERAGYDVETVGVDIEPQPRFPFTFVQGDALDPPVRLEDFDFVHASPPCQGYSRMRHLPWLKDRVYPLLIDPTREMLKRTGVPWVIENVEDAPLEKASTLFGEHGVWLCGRMFDLPLYRHRIFESSFPIAQPHHPKHEEVIFGGRNLNSRYSQGGHGGVVGVLKQGVEIMSIAGHTSGVTVAKASKALGIDWMRRDELTQAIPPAMTDYIGSQLLDRLQRTGAAS